MRQEQRGKEYGEYVSTLYPLWTGAGFHDDLGDGANDDSAAPTSAQLFEMFVTLNNTLLDEKHVGGVPTSSEWTDQQWDYPNAWPPLQWIAIEAVFALRRKLSPAAFAIDLDVIADSIIYRYVRTTFCGSMDAREEQDSGKHLTGHPWKRDTFVFGPYAHLHFYQRRRRGVASVTNRTLEAAPPTSRPPLPSAMFEKYDVRAVGSPGDGGEYVVQAGFGWTNGVLLDLLERYGNRPGVNERVNALDADLCAAMAQQSDKKTSMEPLPTGPGGKKTTSASADMAWIVLGSVVGAGIIIFGAWLRSRREPVNAIKHGTYDELGDEAFAFVDSSESSDDEEMALPWRGGRNGTKAPATVILMDTFSSRTGSDLGGTTSSSSGRSK